MIALVIGAVFHFGFRRSGPWGAFWIFLLILFLAGLAGRFWITPAGPAIWGFAWFPLIFWVFMIALLIVMASPVQNERIDTSGNQDRIISKSDAERVARDNASGKARTSSADAAFGIIFWLMIFLFIAAIIAGFIK